jgi:hypothetical protein
MKEVATLQDFEDAVQFILYHESSLCRSNITSSSSSSSDSTSKPHTSASLSSMTCLGGERGEGNGEGGNPLINPFSPAYESIAARELIKADATNRIGELAVTAMAQHSSSAIDIWQIWAKRDVKGQMAMLKLMLR